MKILMINSVCGIRSTGRICTDLASALEKQGHEVKIAYGRENVPECFQKYAVRIGTDFDVKMHGIKARLFDGSGWGSKRATIHFIEWVKAYDPDIIHLHNIHGYYINIEVLFNYLRTCGKKIIWTLHDCWAFTGHSAYCESANCIKWKSGCYNCPKKNSYPLSMIDQSRFNWENKKKLFTGIPNLLIVTPSNWLKDLVKESFLSDYEITVINNGINTAVFKPRKSDIKNRLGISKKKVLLGVASVWERRKGLDDFIELSNLLDDRYQIVLVGLSLSQIKRLPPRIIGIERTDSISELVDLYSAADVFLNLTYEDNYPTTNLEARACGTPVITYDTGGSPESAGMQYVVKKGDLSAVLKMIGQCNDLKSTTEEQSNVIDNELAINEYIVKAYENI